MFAPVTAGCAAAIIIASAGVHADSEAAGRQPVFMHHSFNILRNPEKQIALTAHTCAVPAVVSAAP